MVHQTQPRRRMSADDRREQILDITHAIVDADGFHAATLNRINYIYPLDEELHRKLGTLYAELGDKKGTVREFEALVASNPNDQAGSRYLLAKAYSDVNRVEDAKDQVIQALEAELLVERIILLPEGIGGRDAASESAEQPQGNADGKDRGGVAPVGLGQNLQMPVDMPREVVDLQAVDQAAVAERVEIRERRRIWHRSLRLDRTGKRGHQAEQRQQRYEEPTDQRTGHGRLHDQNC